MRTFSGAPGRPISLVSGQRVPDIGVAGGHCGRVNSESFGVGVIAIDHVQLAMPAGAEDAAREFYEGLLGIPEVAKPANLAARGGCWLEAGALKVHLGVETGFAPARKAHPGFIVDDLAELAARLNAAGFAVTEDEPLAGYDRRYVSDPFGNCIELMQPAAASSNFRHE